PSRRNPGDARIRRPAPADPAGCALESGWRISRGLTKDHGVGAAFAFATFQRLSERSQLTARKTQGSFGKRPGRKVRKRINPAKRVPAQTARIGRSAQDLPQA